MKIDINKNRKMKKFTISLQYLIILISLTFIGPFLTAQSGWQLVHTDTGYFWDMSFVAGADNSWETGWVITTNSEILKTTDGGDTWTTITQTETTSLNGICFVDENTGFISSATGKIIKSTDGGLTWTTNNSSASWLGQISFKDSQNGAVVGTPNMYTTDGGDTWQTATGPEAYGRVDYGGGDTYYASAILASAFGKSIDNGQTWTNTTIDNIPVVCDFIDENNGMTGGNDFTVMLTTDGGESWTESELNNGTGDFLSGGFYDTDTIYAAGSEKIYMTTDAGAYWTEDTVITGATFRSMFVTPTNVVYAGDQTGTTGKIWRKKGVLPLIPLFEASDTLICSGTTVDFTDFSVYNVTSWQWTFEGGTPASSTDQNPSVTYNSPGEYDVELTVSDGTRTETLLVSQYISVFETPAQADTPDGESNVCTGQYYTYTIAEVAYAQDYEWELSPSDAGTFEADELEASLFVSDDWTGDFTIKARATNLCGDGDWSDMLEGTVFQSPEEFTLQGGGGYCEGSEGVEITLSGSQTGIDYELYLDGSATGQIVAGTGDALSFGNQAIAGNYEALGYNSSCSLFMSEQIEVAVYELPTPVVDGLDMVCDWSEESYEVTNNEGSVYAWEVTGGTITEGQDTHMITVAWNGEGIGSVIVEEETAEGCSGSSDQFDVIIDDCTAIDENVVEGLKIYPNPATSQLNISFIANEDQDGEIVIYNQVGQVIMSRTIAGKNGMQTLQFNTSNLTNGVYLIKIQSDEKSMVTRQFIKN